MGKWMCRYLAVRPLHINRRCDLYVDHRERHSHGQEVERGEMISKQRRLRSRSLLLGTVCSFIIMWVLLVSGTCNDYNVYLWNDSEERFYVRLLSRNRDSTEQWFRQDKGQIKQGKTKHLQGFYGQEMIVELKESGSDTVRCIALPRDNFFRRDVKIRVSDASACDAGWRVAIRESVYIQYTLHSILTTVTPELSENGIQYLVS
jgi:hypothetical protein